MFRIFTLIIALLSTPVWAEESAVPLTLAAPACLEGQEQIMDVSGARSICYWSDNNPRFGCPEDWILVTRGDAFESCTPKPDHPTPTQIELPEPIGFCPEGQVVYYRLSGPHCAPRFEDAGTPCANALDCDGTCLGDTVGLGVCSAAPLSFGCTDFLGADGRPIAICID